VGWEPLVEVSVESELVGGLVLFFSFGPRPVSKPAQE
jgi:hypothetical protein